MTYDLNTITFIDIETVPRHSWADLPQQSQLFFLKKFKRQIEEFAPNLFTDKPSPLEEMEKFTEFYQLKASLHAEWNQVVCVALGAVVDVTKENPRGRLFVRSFSSPLEETILSEVAASLSKRKPIWLCAHNGLGFDFPVLTRKYMTKLNNFMPPIFQNHGKKPWDMPFIDTQNIWACGEFKYFVSLDQLASLFGLESPKGSMDGSQVAEAFKAGRIDDIRKYCAADVVTCANVFLKMFGEPIYEPSQIEIR